MSERTFEMAFTAWSEAVERVEAAFDREREEEHLAELRAKQTEDARLAPAGLEKRQCEVCGNDFRREIESHEVRCDSCRSLTCRECDAVAEDVFGLAPDGRGCSSCRLAGEIA